MDDGFQSSRVHSACRLVEPEARMLVGAETLNVPGDPGANCRRGRRCHSRLYTYFDLMLTIHGGIGRRGIILVDVSAFLEPTGDERSANCINSSSEMALNPR